MPHAAPGDIGDVQQPIQTAQIDKCAEIRDVFHNALAHLAHFQRLQNLLAQALALFFQHHAPRHHDIAPVFVQFDDAEWKHIADELVEILHLFDVDLRPRQKGIHAKQIHHNAALDAAHQAAFDDLVVVVGFFDPVPYPHKIGLGLGQHHLAFLIFDTFEKHLDFVAYLYGRGIAKFRNRNGAFGFEADIDHHRAFGNRQHPARDDFPLFNGLQGAVVEIHHLAEFVVAVLALIKCPERLFRTQLGCAIHYFGFFGHASNILHRRTKRARHEKNEPEPVRLKRDIRLRLGLTCITTPGARSLQERSCRLLAAAALNGQCCASPRC